MFHSFIHIIFQLSDDSIKLITNDCQVSIRPFGFKSELRLYATSNFRYRVLAARNWTHFSTEMAMIYTSM